ncbi:MAG: class I SAM-dependent methyltransferase [Archangium sp.]|nr:class I SAM-dependent methyltransferase [Archangium sp.]
MRDDFYEAYARYEKTHWWFEGRRRIVRSVLERHLTPRRDRRILDVGSGTGGMVPLLRSFGTVDCVESSAEGRAFISTRYPDQRVLPGELPHDLPDGQWHAVTAFDVIEHVDDAVGSLQAMAQRLTPGGQVIVTVPALQFLWSHHDDVNQHKRRYTQSLLVEQLEAAKLRVTSVSYYNSLLFPAVAAARLVQKLRPRPAEADGDLDPTPVLVNAVLTRLFAAERHLLSRVRLPVGISLVAVAQRADE